MIIICINDNAVINGIYGILEDLICSSKFPQANERISSKFIDSLNTYPYKVSPALL
jgi:hypothetical protein